MSEEALQTAEKRREVKGKGEKERYTHLNAEFQIATMDKTAFLSEQGKEIGGKSRMKKTRDLIKKIREGEEPRWRRSRTGRTLSPPQIHQKSI